MQLIFEHYGSPIDKDDAIKIITVVYSMINVGVLLKAENYRDPDVMGQVAQWCQQNINNLISSLRLVLQTSLENQRLRFGVDYKSINSLIPVVALATRQLIPVNNVADQAAITNRLAEQIRTHFSDWIFSGLLLGTWAARTDTQMGRIAGEIHRNPELDFSGLVRWWIVQYRDKLLDEVNNIGALDRAGFFKYAPYLRIWTNSDNERREAFNQIYNHRDHAMDVDHIVPVNWLRENNIGIGNEIVYSIGNSMLMPKDLNVAKSDNLYGRYQFTMQHRNTYQKKFLVSDSMFDGTRTGREISDSIKERENQIIEFFRNRFNLYPNP